jgi:hypothetical protein
MHGFDLTYFSRSQRSKFKISLLVAHFVTIWPRMFYPCVNMYTLVPSTFMPNLGPIGLQIWLPGGWWPSWNTNLTLWTLRAAFAASICSSQIHRRAAFASSKFACLLIGGTVGSRGTSALFLITTFFYAVSSIFFSKSNCFWPNSLFLQKVW